MENLQVTIPYNIHWIHLFWISAVIQLVLCAYHEGNEGGAGKC